MRKISLFLSCWLGAGLLISLPTVDLRTASITPAEPINYQLPLQIQGLVNDPLFNQQTNLTQVKAESAWQITTGGPLIVALIDTGVAINHEDLIDKLWVNSQEIAGNGLDDDNNGYIDDVHGYNFLQNNTDMFDNNGHGTSVAGIIAAKTNNAKGIAGINWNAKIMVLKALNSLGGGEYAHVASAVRYAVDNGAKVINMSFGTYINSAELESAVDYAISRNVTIVAAAGNNNNQDKLLYPANYPSVIAVGAVDSAGFRASFSNYGGNLDVVAPGINIPTAYYERSDAYAKNSGTSYAAAHVTGLVSLMLSLRADLSPQQIESTIKKSAVPNNNSIEYGSGLIDARATLDAIAQMNLLSATVTASTNAVLADGNDQSIITIRVESGNLPAATRLIKVTIKGSPLKINNTLTASDPTDIGFTNAQGIIQFTVSAYTSGARELHFIDVLSNNELSSIVINFDQLSSESYQVALVSRSPDVNLTVGGTATIWVDLKNTGSAPWVGSGSGISSQFKLGASNPLDRSSKFYHSSWLSANRAATFSQPVIYPGETGRISFMIQANTSGTYREYFNPVIEYIKWLNLPISWKITVSKPNLAILGSGYQAELISRSPDLELTVGQRATLNVVFKNTGSTDWPSVNKSDYGAIKLGTAKILDRNSAFYISNWLSKNRAVGSNSQVSPTGQFTFLFEMQAPNTPGTYYESFRLVSEYITWFGPIVTWKIKVI